MLKNLLKYELKSTARTFLPLYGVLIVFALINKIFFGLASNGPAWPVGIGLSAYFGIIVAIGVMTFLVIIQRFYRNLLTDEGYLMFTLPAATSSLVISKSIAALIWIILGTFTTWISIFILSFDSHLFSTIAQEFQILLEQFYFYTGMPFSLVVFEFIIFGFLSVLSGVFTLYAAIAIGHLFSKNRVLASFGAFLGLNIALQAIFTFVINMAALLNLDTWFYNLSDAATFQFALLASIMGAIVTIIALFALTNYILNRKLNLE